MCYEDGDNGEDVGGLMADYDYEAEHPEEIQEQILYEIRKQRELNLKGKYLITCKGIKSKQTVYLQDRKISKGGFWTQFKSNALGFDTKQGAEKIAKTFRYNNPKVIPN